MEEIQTLAIDAIKRRPENRAVGGFDEERLAELTESVREHGVINPITVRQAGKFFDLVAGERRWLAAQRAGLDEIPAAVLGWEVPELEVELISLAENLQRDDMHPLDECDAFVRLEHLGLSVADIAARVGRSQPHVYGRLRLAKLIPQIRARWIEGDPITLRVADMLARTPTEHQERVLEKAMRNGMGIGRQQNWTVENWLTSATDVLAEAPFDIHDADLLDDRPACGACPLRIAWQSDLFEEVHHEDRCGDRDCWRSKSRAHLAKVETRLQDQGVEFRHASNSYHTSSEDVLDSGEWEELTPEAAQEVLEKGGTVENVLVVDGADAGKVVRAQVEEREPMPTPRDHVREHEERKARKAQYLAERTDMLTHVSEAVQGMSAVDVRQRMLMNPVVLRRMLRALIQWENAVYACDLLGVAVDDESNQRYMAIQHARRAVDGLQGQALHKMLVLMTVVQDLDEFTTVDEGKEPESDLVAHFAYELARPVEQAS